MVRLVFRPYTQIRRSICTSESLRASTRVSPGFTLFRHSSHIFRVPTCMLTLRPFSRRIVAGGLCPKRSNHCYFHCARGFTTPVLAHMLDSLVRVSRRGKENHFASITSVKKTTPSVSSTTKWLGIGTTSGTYLPNHHLP
jgi:hypothetical protein